MVILEPGVWSLLSLLTWSFLDPYKVSDAWSLLSSDPGIPGDGVRVVDVLLGHRLIAHELLQQRAGNSGWITLG